MKSTLKYIGLLICMAHFSMLFIFNMAHLAKGNIKPLFMRGLHVIRQCTTCNTYTNWTGLLGGYGFYSPAVGNTYQIQFCRHTQGSKKYYNSPGLKSQTAQMRFQSYLDVSSALLDPDDSKQIKEKLQAKASTEAACKYLMKYMPCDSVEGKLITKEISRLAQMQTTKPIQPHHLALYRYVQISKQSPK